VTDAQALLADDEALVSYFIFEGAMHLWLVRPDALHMFKIGVGSEDLQNLVQHLRAGLDPPANFSGPSDIPPFDTAKAHELYEMVFAPVAPYLDGVQHLLVVPDGSLESIPFSIFVTEPPAQEIDDWEDYRDVPWLARDYALTTLPSVSSLRVRALRVFSKQTGEETSPFVGFGDPLLDGSPSGTKGPSLASLFNRGAIANVEIIRNMSALPKSADELRLIADSLGANEDSIYIRENATEKTVKSLDLSGSEVIAFATHALVAGGLTKSAEPGLILTPPEEGTKIDDGFLTASEVAQLKLYPGLVILSACNTASSDGTPGAKGLSGLAKAFFYAGSRTLLVSHWAVESDASKRLTTGMFKAMDDDSDIGPAEALRRSMSDLLDDEDSPWLGHPMFWAPFVVVGEGQTLQ
jgi:CHAT domain-containing protein